MLCPVCQTNSELLTARQAAILAQVNSQSIRRWLASGKAHGVKTPGGQHRICKNSLFRASGVSLSNLQTLSAWFDE
jgi:predicted site-specific integrase-resolvase